MVKHSTEKTQEEILQEIARALGHAGNMLEDALEKLKEIEYLMGQTGDRQEYNILVDKFNKAREYALFRKDMLIIHREALGLRQHRFIDTCYPIPQKKRRNEMAGFGIKGYELRNKGRGFLCMMYLL